MNGLREYLMGVVAAALLCGIANGLVPGHGASKQALKLLAGMLMALAVVRPWVQISMDDLFGWTGDIMQQAEAVASQGANLGAQAYYDGIKQRLEAYILDEAEALGAQIEVDVELSEDEILQPARAVICGALSPSARNRLETLLTKELGISREEIQWN